MTWDWVSSITGFSAGAIISGLWLSLKHKNRLYPDYIIPLESKARLLEEAQSQLNSIRSEYQSLSKEQQDLLLSKTRLETLLNESKEQELTLSKLTTQNLLQAQQILQEEAEKTYQQKQVQIEEKIKGLVEPLSKILQENAKKVEQVEKQHLTETASLQKHLELLVTQTQRLIDEKNTLVQALQSSKGKGDWGEMELIRLLEESGLLPGVHYDTQTSLKSGTAGDQLQRPDITIKLPNQRILYVDAKTILVNLERLEASANSDNANDDTQKEDRKKHAQSLEKEILSLSKKAYDSKNEDSIDFVILYVPRESMLRVALEERPELMETAFRNRVILASPLLLMAILKTVSYGWQQAQLSQNARQIQEVGTELHRRASRFAERLIKLGERLEQAANAFQDTKTAFSGHQGMMPQLKKIEALGCQSEKKLPESLLESTEISLLPDNHTDIENPTRKKEPANC